MTNTSSEWFGWLGEDLIVEVALDPRGAAAELSRLRNQVDNLGKQLEKYRAESVTRSLSRCDDETCDICTYRGYTPCDGQGA